MNNIKQNIRDIYILHHIQTCSGSFS